MKISLLPFNRKTPSVKLRIMISLGRGHSGAHLTLLFSIEDSSDDPLFQGSLGVGICLEDGVEAFAKGEEGRYGLEVDFVKGIGDLKLYEEVLEYLSKDLPDVLDLSWELKIKLELPTSQGFGMSASGAIAAAEAFQRAIGIPYEECRRRAFLIAHLVERNRSTGLGDTTALSAGGVERRLKAGSPYNGEKLMNGPGISEGWSDNIPVLLAWKERTGTHTANYIDNIIWKENISSAGLVQMDELSKGNWDRSRWNDILDSAQKFVEESKLIDDLSRNELRKITNQCLVSMGLEDNFVPLLCMLGESIAIVPRDLSAKYENIELISNKLQDLGVLTSLSRVGATKN